MKYYLSVDYGGTNTKAIIFDQKGKQISVSSFSTLKMEEKSGYREIDLLKTWEAISHSIQEAIQKAEIEAEDICAVACIGHGKGLYLLDKAGKEFTNGILSTDERAIGLAADFEARVDQIWDKTRQHVVGVQNPVLLRWLKEHEPAIFQEIGAVLSAKDYVRFKLTGKVNQEFGDASGNHWINFEKDSYDAEILDFFGIPEIKEALPPLVECGEIVGGVSPQAAKETGLLEGTPVIGGLFDIDACAIGSGVLTDDTFSVIAGTWNINTYPSKTPAPQSSGQMNSYFPNKDFLIEESSPTSAGNLEIMLKLLMAEEIKTLRENGETIYDTLEVFLENTDASFSKVIFFPFLYGSNVAAHAQSCFLGLTSTTTKSEMIRAVYEGISFAHKFHIDKLEKTRGKSPAVIRLSGGGTNSAQWCQLFADVLNMDIEVLEGSELGGLGGAVMAAQTLQGTSIEETVESMVHVRQRFSPNPLEHEKYLVKYQTYLKSLEGLQSVWESFHQMKQKLE